MSALFASGAVIDLILVLVVIEALALFAWHRFSRRGPVLTDLLPSLAAGACLLLAVRAALQDRPWPWVAVALTAGLLAHLIDLSRRWTRAPFADARDSPLRVPARAVREKDYDPV